MIDSGVVELVGGDWVVSGMEVAEIGSRVSGEVLVDGCEVDGSVRVV